MGMPSRPYSALLVLCIGDGLVLGLVTLAGFATHGELATAGFRLLTTFLPLAAAWALISPWLGVFDHQYSLSFNQLWRPVLAMLLAAPMAGWLRGVWLGAPIVPSFVLVLGAVSAGGLLIWRGFFLAGARLMRRLPRQKPPRLQERGQHG